MPDNIYIDLQLQDWLFVLEGVDGVSDRVLSPSKMDLARSWEEKFWRSTFRCLRVTACLQDTPKAASESSQNGTSSNLSAINKVTVSTE